MTTKAIIKNMDEVLKEQVTNSTGATIQVLLGPDDSMPNFYTRRFSIQAGGHIPLHRHDVLEHEQVVLSGSMTLVLDGQEHTVKQGDCIYIPAGVAHSYHNSGQEPVVFLCMVPALSDYKTEWIS